MSAEETTEPDEVLTDDELQAAAAPERPLEEEKPRKRTVVVAEDESVNRMDLVAMLEDNGYEVVGEAANGEEAVDLTRKFRPSGGGHHLRREHRPGCYAYGVLPVRSGEEGYRRWCHGVCYQAV